jgi:hypothetical protein
MIILFKICSGLLIVFVSYLLMVKKFHEITGRKLFYLLLVYNFSSFALIFIINGITNVLYDNEQVSESVSTSYWMLFNLPFFIFFFNKFTAFSFTPYFGLYSSRMPNIKTKVQNFLTVSRYFFLGGSVFILLVVLVKEIPNSKDARQIAPIVLNINQLMKENDANDVLLEIASFLDEQRFYLKENEVLEPEQQLVLNIQLFKDQVYLNGLEPYLMNKDKEVLKNVITDLEILHADSLTLVLGKASKFMTQKKGSNLMFSDSLELLSEQIYESEGYLNSLLVEYVKMNKVAIEKSK